MASKLKFSNETFVDFLVQIYITDDVSEYFLQFLAYFYNQEVGKSLESVFYPAQIITTTHLNKDDVVTMKMITLP